MSSVLRFNREFLRPTVNILSCLTMDRKRRLSPVNGRPWAAGLNRLLAERRLKKGALADLATDDDGKPMRAGTISSILNADIPPKTTTLLRLIDGFHAYDRQHPDLKLPPVELWEFFVSDEQSEILRHRDATARAAVDERSIEERVMQRLLNRFSEVARDEIRAELRPVAAKGGKHR